MSRTSSVNLGKKSSSSSSSSSSHKSKIKYRCEYSSTPLKVLQARGWTRVQDSRDSSWDLWWCETSELKLALDGPTRLEARQRVSHFRNHCELTRKNYLYRNLKRYKRLLVKANKKREAELCDAMPLTFELPAEYRMLVEEHRRCHGTTWIVKPAAGSQGRGIFLVQRLKDLAEWRLKECIMIPEVSDMDPIPATPPPTYVVQKYIDNPYLLEGRKFDLRIYVLVTSFQPLKVWLAREGFARLSGEQFSLERINERRVHLTNMSIQLKAEKKSSEQESKNLGRKWPLNCLKCHLIARHGVEVVDRLLRSIAAESQENDSKLNGANGNHGNEEVSPCQLAQDANGTKETIDNIVISQPPRKISNGVEDLQSSTPETDEKSKPTDSLVNHESSLPNEDTQEPIKESEESMHEDTCENLKSEDSTDHVDQLENDVQHDNSEESPVTKEETNDAKETTDKSRKRYKTLRVGWLHKDHPSDRRYKKMKRPGGCVKRLKLDESMVYSAAEIRRLATEEFQLPEDEYDVSLGLFGGEPITDFTADNKARARKTSNGLDDIWTYCKLRNIALYQLNLYLLTTKKLQDNVRLFYHYSRVSKYSSETIYTECDKLQLHGYLTEQQCGDGPELEQFEPVEYGYQISRIEVDGEVLLQVYVEDEEEKEKKNGSVAGSARRRSFHYPSAKETPGPHEIVHELQGVYEGLVGLGLVTSCTDICNPLFTWYKNGVVWKSAEQLCWISADGDDERPQVWTCTVTCSSSDKELKSKEFEV